uniref:SGNH hydrolase-type esterase domain-containing protein n=1 Tax=Scleropages formosus TaxID=113540 RepID=A0A8C9VK19_SCLFO
MESLFDISSILNISSDSTPVCCVSCNMYCLITPADIVEHFICSKCVTNNDLVPKVRELKERIKNLISIRETESWLDSVYPDASVVSNSVSRLTGPSTANEKPGLPERAHGDWVTVRIKSNKAKPKPGVPGSGSPVQTQNRYLALSSSVSHVRVSDMEARVSSLADNAVSTIMVHVGGNDIHYQLSEVLKSRFISICNKARRKCCNLIVSGPLPSLFMGDIVYSRLVSFNRPRFFTLDGIYLNWRGSFLLSQNLACKLQD